MRSVITFICLLTTLGLLSTAAKANDYARNHYALSELHNDLADHRLDDFSLLEAAIIAGGEKLSGSPIPAMPTKLQQHRFASRESSAALLQWMHAELLEGRYQKSATLIPTALDGGNYNCVVATVLYISLADQLGWKTTIVETPGHVFCKLHEGDESWDIEPTYPQWFELTSAERENSPLHARDSRRELTRTDLLARLMYNRGVNRLQNGEFSAAIDLLKLSYQWDAKNPAVRENLCAGYNNWAIQRSSHGDFAGALSLIHQGRKIDPSYRYFELNERHIRQQQLKAVR